MAEVQTIVTLSETIEPLSNLLGTPSQAFTPIPQHVLILHDSEAIAAPGAGNNVKVTLEQSLPEDYVYKLTDFAVVLYAFTSADLAGFSSILGLNTQHVAPASGETISHQVPCNSWGTVQAGAVGAAASIFRAYVPERLPSYPVDAVGSFNLRFNMTNTVLATQAFTFELYARLLAFDKQQYDYWPLHTPDFVSR